MQIRSALITTVIGLVAVSTGCSSTPAPPRVPVPAAAGHEPMVRQDEIKPLPDQGQYNQPPPPIGFDDVPLVNQQPPEEPAYLDAYNRVGRPRIVVFVNRTLEGNIIPVNPTAPEVSVEYNKKASAGVTIEKKETSTAGGVLLNEKTEKTDKFQTTSGPGEYKETAAVYLKQGQYDEASAKSLDYEAVENVLTDWLAANNQVTIISPIMTRSRLTDQELKELQAGRPQMLSELAQKLETDVLVQVQAHPTKQTADGLQIRIIVEAINTRGGQSIARAVVDVPPPLDKTQINKYTRFLARKLMQGMTGSWTMIASNPPPPPPAPAPPQNNSAPSNPALTNPAPEISPAPAPAPVPQKTSPPVMEQVTPSGSAATSRPSSQ